VLQEIPSQRLATGDQTIMGVRRRENGKEGEGQEAGSTHASANFNPVVGFIMSLFAPPAVPDNRIVQTLRTTAEDLFLTGGSPVENWVARIAAKWDKENRTAWEARCLNRVLSGSVFRRGFPLPPEIKMKAIIFLCEDRASTCKIGEENPTCFLLSGLAARFSFESSIRISDVTLKGRSPGCVRCFVFSSQRI
jgi:hypothetical protein